MENKDVSRIFDQIADLLEIGGHNPFRIRSFRRASQVIADLPFGVAQASREGDPRLGKTPGLGKGSLARIGEIVATGTCEALETLSTDTPVTLLDLLRLPGLGPKRVQLVWSQLGISTLQELRSAALAGRLSQVDGIGDKSVRRILESIELALEAKGRHRLDRASRLGRAIVEHLGACAECQRIVQAGSVRRGCETVGDIDILVSCSDAPSVMEVFLRFPGIQRVLARGPTKCSVRLSGGVQCDLRVVEDGDFGAALQYFTGSKQHNVRLRERAKKLGLKISEYGVFRVEDGRRVGGSDESDVYAALGLKTVPPELRENRGEIEAAAGGATFGELVRLEDVRGQLHLHTTDSDGRDSLPAMAGAARDMGYEYLAITDHSSSLAMIGGLDEERLALQCEAIDRFNREEPGIRVLKGIEVDILPDGGLDMSDEALSRLDLVVASVHSRFDMGEAEMTRRICRALEHPSVNILGHPTGRILLRRRPYRLDLEAVVRCACRNRVCLEINAHPKRLDLSDIQARMARDQGALLSINADAHRTGALSRIRYGVALARRAWLGREDVINTYSWPRLQKILRKETYR